MGGIIGILSFIGVLVFAAFYESFATVFGQGGANVSAEQLYVQAGVGMIVSAAGLIMAFALRQGNALMGVMIGVGIIVLIAGSVAGILPAALFFAASYKARSPVKDPAKHTYCSNCGTEIITAAKYCSKCGTEIKPQI